VRCGICGRSAIVCDDIKKIISIENEIKKVKLSRCDEHKDLPYKENEHYLEY